MNLNVKTLGISIALLISSVPVFAGPGEKDLYAGTNSFDATNLSKAYDSSTQISEAPADGEAAEPVADIDTENYADQAEIRVSANVAPKYSDAYNNLWTYSGFNDGGIYGTGLNSAYVRGSANPAYTGLAGTIVMGLSKNLPANTLAPSSSFDTSQGEGAEAGFRTAGDNKSGSFTNVNSADTARAERAGAGSVQTLMGNHANAVNRAASAGFQ